MSLPIFYLPLHIWEDFIDSRGYPTWNNPLAFNWFKAKNFTAVEEHFCADYS